jgi:hypothetical protein
MEESRKFKRDEDYVFSCLEGDRQENMSKGHAERKGREIRGV